MYLHLGADITVASKDIVGIFDYKLTESELFTEFITGAKWEDRVINIQSPAKSVVVTVDKVYFAPVSRGTLVRRWSKNAIPFSIMLDNGV